MTEYGDGIITFGGLTNFNATHVWTSKWFHGYIHSMHFDNTPLQENDVLALYINRPSDSQYVEYYKWFWLKLWKENRDNLGNFYDVREWYPLMSTAQNMGNETDAVSSNKLSYGGFS